MLPDLDAEREKVQERQRLRGEKRHCVMQKLWVSENRLLWLEVSKVIKEFKKNDRREVLQFWQSDLWVSHRLIAAQSLSVIC